MGVPAAIRPYNGSCTDSAASASARGRVPASAKSPVITSGWNVDAFGAGFAAPDAAEFSGNFITSRARARCGRRRIKPRSSNPVIKRWMPDLDFKPSASFISSNEGDTPPFFNDSSMNIRSSYCLRVSI